MNRSPAALQDFGLSSYRFTTSQNLSQLRQPFGMTVTALRLDRLRSCDGPLKASRAGTTSSRTHPMDSSTVPASHTEAAFPKNDGEKFSRIGMVVDDKDDRGGGV